MIKQPLMATLLSMVGGHMGKDGYVLRKARNSFQKEFSWGTADIHLHFIKHNADFDVTVDVGVRFDALEELVNKDDPHMSEKDKKERGTMGAELGNLTQVTVHAFRIPLQYCGPDCRCVLHGRRCRRQPDPGAIAGSRRCASAAHRAART